MKNTGCIGDARAVLCSMICSASSRSSTFAMRRPQEPIGGFRTAGEPTSSSAGQPASRGGALDGDAAVRRRLEDPLLLGADDRVEEAEGERVTHPSLPPLSAPAPRG